MEKLIAFILAFEAGVTSGNCHFESNMLRFREALKSGYSDDPRDPGGATQCGVTLGTYRGYCQKKGYPVPSKKMLRNIPYNHWKEILQEYFWKPSGGGQIAEPLAWLITDWVWASGPKVLKRVQRLIGVKQDGIIGPKTIDRLNFYDVEFLFDILKDERRKYLDECIAKNKTLEIYRKGWLRRLESITFERLIY